MRQVSPLTARFVDIQNRIPDPSQIDFQRAARPYSFVRTKAFFHNLPFFIREIAGISFSSHHFKSSSIVIQIRNL